MAVCLGLGVKVHTSDFCNLPSSLLPLNLPALLPPPSHLLLPVFPTDGEECPGLGSWSSGAQWGQTVVRKQLQYRTQARSH